MRKVFIPGGSWIWISSDQMDEPPHLCRSLCRDQRGTVVADGIASGTGQPDHVRKTGDNYLISYVKKAGLISFGPEPLVAYLWAKENEIKLIRIVMVGKINGLPADDIKERLRDVYA